MAEIEKTTESHTPVENDRAGTRQGVTPEAAKQESGGYGGTDRLQSEAAPLHPNAGKAQGENI